MKALISLMSCVLSLGCAGGQNMGESGNNRATSDRGGMQRNAPSAPGASDTLSPSKPVVKPIAPPPPPPDPLRPRDDLAPDAQMRIIIDGQERIVERASAAEAGYIEIDLSDDWTPYIFKPFTDEAGAVRLNRYRSVFIGLANDKTDGDGRALPKNEKNFLEVFGVPPSIGVIRDRTIGDADSECHQSIDYDLISSVDQIVYRTGKKRRNHNYRIRVLRKKFKKAMKKANVESIDDLLATKPKWQKDIDYLKDHERQIAVLAEVEKRLDCDNHNHKRYRHKKGRLDQGLDLAVRRFQRKHMIYEWHRLRRKTMALMGVHHDETNFQAFKRALTERIFAATGILEDGTADKVTGKPPTYTGKDGQTHPVRNLKEEFLAAALKGLDVETPDKLKTFFRRHPRSDFKQFKIGIKFPPYPEYYGPHMELDYTIDRGWVWYDFPYTDSGKKKRQRRKRMPKASLWVTYQGERFPLVHWPTTIGGWRTDLAANGYTYLKYKGSDVGKRIIRKVIAGPTWIAPPSTPLKSLVKRKWINGKAQNMINYDEMGPGYLSAYGLVAGYFVMPGRNGNDVDRGIRAHGSSDYMSLLSSSRFSHGCHRLMNHHAVRLFGFILNHRHHTIAGDQVMDYHRQFLYRDQVYEMRVPSRGFQYTLDPPLPVDVLEGTIKGKAKKPLEGYFKIPGEPYPVELPTSEIKEG
ncbi:MAG: hypothetical protein VX589_15035 [Myxococcota bacterium]|nr:hypothetical protein [Myxococcota bacterium]